MKKYLRFSLFKCLVLFTLVSICFGLFGKRYYRANAQREAVEALRSDGNTTGSSTHGLQSQMGTFRVANSRSDWNMRVKLVYDFEIGNDIGPIGYVAGNPNPKNLNLVAPLGPTPSGLSKWFGVDFMHDIELVEFDRVLNVEDVKQLQKLKGMKRLVLGSGIEDFAAVSGLEKCHWLEEITLDVVDKELFPSLANFPKLTRLEMRGGVLSKNDIEKISESKTLQEIRLSSTSFYSNESYLASDPSWYTSVRDFGLMPSVQSFYYDFNSNEDSLEFVANFPNLRKLYLDGSFNFTNNGVAALGSLHHLEKLIIKSTGPTFQRVRKFQPFAVFRDRDKEADGETENEIEYSPLSNLTQLKFAVMEFGEFTDSGAQHLSSATDLERLSLSTSAVGNAGMDWIEQLPRLKILKLGYTKVTRSGIEGLKAKNPSCEIVWD